MKSLFSPMPLAVPIRLLARLAVTVAILAILCARMDWDALSGHVDSVSVRNCVAAACLVGAQVALLAARWRMLVNIGHSRLSTSSALKIGFISQLANLLFVTSIGGMITRIAMTVRAGTRLANALAATILDRALTLGALIAVAALFAPRLGGIVAGQAVPSALMVAGSIVAALAITLPLIGQAGQFLTPQAVLKNARLRYIIRYMRIFCGRRTLHWRVFALSLLAQACLFAAVFALATAAAPNLTFLNLMTVLPMISIVAALPVSVGGWGIREGAFVYGLGLLGVPMESAFFISVQLGLAGMAVALLVGLPLLILSSVGRRGTTENKLMAWTAPTR